MTIHLPRKSDSYSIHKKNIYEEILMNYTGTIVSVLVFVRTLLVFTFVLPEHIFLPGILSNVQPNTASQYSENQGSVAVWSKLRSRKYLSNSANKQT